MDQNILVSRNAFCEIWGRDKKVSLDSLACYHPECGGKSHLLVGM
jgi:hypothetical protein